VYVYDNEYYGLTDKKYRNSVHDQEREQIPKKVIFEDEDWSSYFVDARHRTIIISEHCTPGSLFTNYFWL